ncbi:MAG: hypothetical protein E6H66_20930 [Betaproteobacteria bacterium]|nr:MAG: hypothetical protein E6H66_20930 [Betaproteobacteria bacterium]
MKPAITLRIASALAFIQYSAHAFLFLSARPAHGADEIVVITAMKSHVAGLSRSYWDFYFGYGLMAILSGVVEVVLLWLLAAIAKERPGRVRPAIALFIFANVVHALLVWKYFALVAPMSFDILIAMTLGLAFVSSSNQVVASGLTRESGDTGLNPGHSRRSE